FFLYGYKGKWLIVDCGIGFAGDNLPGVDLLLPNPAFLADKKKDIVGLVITHAHEDHIGAVGYLWRDLQCPIYLTPFAGEILEDKLNEAGLLGRAEVHVVEQGSVLDLAPFEVEFISMTHSLPEPNALAIRTAEGVVVHTGDWKLDTDPLIGAQTDMKQLKKLGKEGVLAMVCDSTNVFGTHCEATEQDVRKTLTDLIAQYPGRQIAVGCFASNVARVESIYHAAKANGREVCLMGRSLWRIEAAGRATGYFKDVEAFLSEDEALERPAGSVLYICTGSQGEPYSALNNLAAVTPQKNAVYFGADDVIIFSSRVIPGNEKSIALLQKRLKAKGIKIITDKEALVHVSGHYAGEDLEKMYQILKPKIALPVHGEAMELTGHAACALKMGAEFAFALENGEVIALDETPQILGEVPAGILAVDGKRILPLDAEVIKKRRKMIEGGSMVVTVVVGKKGLVLGDVQVSSFGLLDSKEEDMAKLDTLIKQNITDLPDEQRLRDDLIQNAVRTTIRKFLNENYGKKPLIDVHLVRI
ncbi:MAG: ribonuclease J, partial [Alphaproteobacteria bacterium]